MSQMLPEAGEVMRRAACGDVCAPAPRPPRPPTRSSENKELLRQQLLSASKERNLDKGELPKVKHTRSRQKNRWKLKFHHQALPQEYLDHYEQSLQKVNNKKKPLEKPKEINVDTSITNETFKIWAQRLAGVQSEIGAVTVPPALSMATRNKEEKKKKSPAITPSKIMTYEDLPYMGEMTLNNSKPRRGRKPKKADICHLIYENYGTVVPGQPPPAERLGQQNSNAHKNTDTSFTIPKTDLQNRIISSLLERKLSQEQKRKLDNTSPPRFCSPDAPPPPAPPTAAGPLHSDHEPLNLCIRDLHDLKLQIQRKFGNIYASSPEIKTELDDEDSVTSEQPNAISVIQRNTNLPSTARSSPSPSPSPSEPCAWPRPCGLYVHPLALQTQLLYYQRLAAAGQLPFATDDEEKTSVSTDNTDVSLDDGRTKLVLKQISELLDPKVIKQVEENKSPELPKKRASPNPAQGPVKRKRSAIFIPPVPVKTNTTTPTTEVSICKFKFTGGSKPSLQEKKMLSVDSGGNFRYYSGTGGKSAKGYEYLHKDLNQQKTEIATTLPKLEPQSTIKEDASKKKRKSRKTLQREKLEQTFKEKGFLIQTQQLQSAEGATYCKFRQLRKFTRYLFRSWKDYLPGELNDHGPAPPGTPGTPPTPPTPASPLSPSTQASSLTPPAPSEWA